MKTYSELQGTNYIFLSDGSMAKKLKPTRVYRKVKFNVRVNGKFTRYDRDEIMRGIFGINPETNTQNGQS